MRFLIRLDNPGRYSPRDCRNLSRAAYESVRGLGADVGNLRVSSSAVELDLLLSNEANLANAIGALENMIGRVLTLRELDAQPTPLAKEEAVKLGLDLFDEERYWESHEALESAWRITTGDERETLQAFILLAASLVHLQKDELNVSLSIMRRALGKLPAQGGRYSSIDLDALKSRVNHMVTCGVPEFFKIGAEHDHDQS
jgi:hypothetical protein